jgi:glyoxylase-like metal-dependent hydrolase (beta-lactamase superfamily II)
MIDASNDSGIAISAEALRDLLDRHQPVAVLDVRASAERAEWAIPGSLHVDAYDRLWAGDPEALAGVDLPTDVPVVTVCGAGRTSLLAALQLRQRGVPARSLSGGMKAWSLAWNSAEIPLPTSETEVVQLRRTGKGCLSYLIGSQGEAAVVDAALEPQVYLDVARRYGWVIARVVETHVHADHLMRSRELAELTGATLYLPEQRRVAYSYTPLRDGDVLDIGAGSLRVLRTPGHTPESSTYLLDRQALFTGDTLFLDGVGRPDLEADPREARERAHTLYHSLRRLADLPGGTLVLPGHTSRPVGFDHVPVWAALAEVLAGVRLLHEPEDTFVATILSRIPATPPNHHLIVELNEAGLLPEVADRIELEAGANRCAVS